MELVLNTTDPTIINTFGQYFPQVQILQYPTVNEIDVWQYDSVLLTGNGYGIFESGYNQSIGETYPSAEYDTREAIGDGFGGFCPNGAAIGTPLTDDLHNPGRLIYAPLNYLLRGASEPSEVYWAARAAFFQARKSGEVKRLLICPIGLEYIPLPSVVAQMRLAYDHVFMYGVDTSHWNTINAVESQIGIAVGAL